METGYVDLPIYGDLAHADVMMCNHRGIDTDLDSGTRGELSIIVEGHEGSPFAIEARASGRATKATPKATPKATVSDRHPSPGDS